MGSKASETKTPVRVKRVRVGVMLGLDRIVAVARPSGTRALATADVHQRPLLPPRDEGWPDLAGAVEELRTALGAGQLALDIAVMRPLGAAKVLAVPRVRSRELRGLVQRGARRYFLGLPEPISVDARPIRGVARGALAPALAAGASAPVVDAIAAAAHVGGAQVESITPAGLALAEALCSAVPRARRGRVTVVVSSPAWVEVLALDSGVPRLLQPLAAAPIPDAQALAAEAVEAIRSAAAELGPARWIIVCGDDLGGQLPLALAAAGADIPPLLRAPALAGVDAAALAAIGATLTGAGTPSLLPEGLRARERERARRRTIVLAAGTAAMLASAAGLHLWGISRELRAVEDARSALAPAFAEAERARRAVEEVRARLETVHRLEGSQVRMTGALAALAKAMPDSAYLTSFSATGPELQLGGMARTASAVIPSLDGSPLLDKATFAAPLRREESSGLERFEITVSLAAEAAEPRPPGARRGPPAVERRSQ